MQAPKFNSLEEVKEFISSTDVQNIGAISFVSEDGNTVSLTMEDFIKKVGLDAAAEFIYKNSKNMVSVMASGDEIREVFKKFMEDPHSLTMEEKAMMVMVKDNFMDKGISVSEGILTVMLKSFLEIGQEFTKDYNGLFAILLTLMEDALILSTECPYTDDAVLYNEVINNVKEQIVIPEGIDELALLLGLLHAVGEKFMKSDFTKNLPVDYHRIAEALDLDTEYIFKNEGKSFEEITDSILSDILSDEEKSDEEKTESSDKIVNIDVRKAMKEDRK